MSTNYTMRVLRPSDRKVIGEVEVNQIKSILEVDEDLLDTRGEDMRIERLYSVSETCLKKMEELRSEIAKAQEGVFKCKSVEVKHEIEDDIAYKKEYLDEWMYAFKAVWQLVGIVHCLSEDMMMSRGKTETGEYDTYQMAYSYWAVDGKDSHGKPTKEYMWAEGAIIRILDSWSRWEDEKEDKEEEQCDK